MNVLIVDDESQMCEMLEGILKDYSNNIHIAHNGSDGFDIFNKFNKTFDLIISDFNMPILNGVEFRKKIFDSNKDCPPFIIYTGNVDGVMRQEIEGELLAVVSKSDIETLEKHIVEIKNKVLGSTNE
ncbi:MAG: response regulator [Halobacteriovoraceae bacterium]|jgi:DNA-binding response OmpR family regulator|nr:response regulator [Halobacteriovoraceae bacterium]